MADALCIVPITATFCIEIALRFVLRIIRRPVQGGSMRWVPHPLTGRCRRRSRNIANSWSRRWWRSRSYPRVWHGPSGEVS